MDKPIKVPVTLVKTWITLVHGQYDPIVKSTNLRNIITNFGSLKQAESYVLANEKAPKQAPKKAPVIIKKKKARTFDTQLKLKSREHYSL
jgi:hypothetical protein